MDVTRPALDYYAEYPVLKVRLPYDFFYPFVTKHPASVMSSAPSAFFTRLDIALALLMILQTMVQFQAAV